jgi:hypothetical protein
VIVVDRQVVNVKIWDTSGMRCVKCFGMLIEDTGGGPSRSGDRRDREPLVKRERN